MGRGVRCARQKRRLASVRHAHYSLECFAGVSYVIERVEWHTDYSPER